MKLNKQFDEQIRQKLEGLEAGFDSASWDLLAHRMDFGAQQEVDDLLKDRLSNIEAPMTTGAAWEAMEQLIDADEAAEQIETEAHLDDVAYSKLRNLEVPFQGHHWALMAKRLEEEFSFRHKLYRYKVAEVVLVALLLLTFIRFMPHMDGWLNNSKSLAHTQAVQHEIDKTEIKPSTADQIASIENGFSETASNSFVENLDKEVRAADNNSGQLPPVTTSDFVQTAGRDNFSPAALPLFDLLILSPTVSGFEKVIAERIEKANILHKKQKRLDKVAVLDSKSVDSGFSWELPISELNPFVTRKDLRFSIFTTTDLNYVLTPPDQINVFDTLVQTAPNKTIASGYGGGITVNFKREKWEFQTGGIYSFKRYIPNTPIFIFETLNYYIMEDFHGIQLDIFQLPLNANYHFKNSGNWRFYATAGASAHFITSSVYEIGYERLALGVPNPPSSPDDTKSIRQEKDFPDGLIDGGSLNDNFYMTANLGLGVERYISPKWTVFFQPNYQHYIMSRGIGTNNDKIYTTSFHLGTKFNLK